MNRKRHVMLSEEANIELIRLANEDHRNVSNWLNHFLLESARRRQEEKEDALRAEV